MRIVRRSLVIVPLLLTAPALAETPQPRPATIAVTGAGEAELKPDFARVLILVSTPADTLQQAVDMNRAATDRVMAKLQSIGVKRDDIRTVNLQTFPTPARHGPDGREIRAPRYTANHQLRVTTRDIEGVGRLAGEIATIEGVNFQSLTWALDKKDAGIDIARRGAVQDARRQAELYAEAAGVKLGRLIEIRDGVVHPYGGVREDAPVAMAARGGEPIPVVPPATLNYTATIQMVWEIAP
jgi:uncharacterized protein YggE